MKRPMTTTEIYTYIRAVLEEKGKMSNILDYGFAAYSSVSIMHKGYEELFIFVPEMRQVIRICEGTGDNLPREDKEEGYVDYIYYDQHELSIDMPVVDGGQVLLEGMFRNLFQCTADCIPRVLDMAYGRGTVGYVILV